MSMPGRSVLALVVAALSTAACSMPESPRGPASAGFASYAGVLGCAELAAWGNVTGNEPVREGLEVGFEVEEWVVPSNGAGSVTFLADDPVREVAAPAWPESEERLLVIVSGTGPTERLDAGQGEQAVQQWRDAGSPRLPDADCERA